MGRAFAEHWKGVAAGLMLYAIWAVYFEVSERIRLAEWEQYQAEIASVAPPPPTLAPPVPASPVPESPENTSASSVPPTREVPCPETAQPADPGEFTEPTSGMESQATAVVENPYGLSDYANPVPLFDRLLTLLTPFGAGALAAWLGRRIVAWRGALTGALASIPLCPVMHIDLGGSVERLQVLAFGGALALMGYAGGGLVKLLTRAHSRAA